MSAKKRDFENWPLNRGWPLNTGPLYTGSTVCSNSDNWQLQAEYSPVMVVVGFCTAASFIAVVIL